MMGNMLVNSCVKNVPNRLRRTPKKPSTIFTPYHPTRGNNSLDLVKRWLPSESEINCTDMKFPSWA